MIFSSQPNRQERILGIAYLAVDFLLLPVLLGTLNTLPPRPLTSGQLNFTYYFINFFSIFLIFRKFLLQSAKDALKAPFPTLLYALLGYLGYRALGELLLTLLMTLYPRFSNINDLSVALSLREDFILMAVGTVLLAPVAEETLFRGLIFRGLYDRSPAMAYLVSMTAFAAVHVTGYIGHAEPALIVLSFLEYLPAGYCLCFAYRRSGTIFSPILMHMTVNAVAVYTMR